MRTAEAQQQRLATRQPAQPAIAALDKLRAQAPDDAARQGAHEPFVRFGAEATVFGAESAVCGIHP